jgi:hypothetical protein
MKIFFYDFYYNVIESIVFDKNKSNITSHPLWTTFGNKFNAKKIYSMKIKNLKTERLLL